MSGGGGWRNRLGVMSPTPLVRGIRLVWQSTPGWTSTQFGLLVLSGLVPLLALWLMKLIVDAVADGVTGGGGPQVLSRIMLLIGIAAAIALIGAAIRTLTVLVAEIQSLHLGDKVHDVLHAKSVAVDLEYYESPSYHDTLHRAQEEAPYRPGRIVDEIARVGQNGLSLLAVTGLLFSFHWLLAVVLFVAAVPGVLVRIRYSRRLYDWTLRQTSAQRKSRYINRLLTGSEHAKEIRLFGLGQVLRERFRELRTAVRTEKLALVRRRSLLELTAQVLSIAAVFASFVFIARAALGGGITLGEMVMYFGAFQRAQDFFGGTLAAMAGLYEDNLFLADLDTFLKLENRVAEPDSPRPIPRPLRSGIAVESVSFAYPGQGREVLADINFEIAPGEHVALVGENGSGKTTLVKLLCRLYDPDSGSIRLDGIDIREFALADLHREIGIIFQDYARYHLTARENIRFGNVDLPDDDPRIIEAAVRTGADSVIRKLNHGYDTVLGRQFDDGAELSIGEWQKVAIARAFLRSSQIIVLDEPTASLDARSEAEVFERFHELARDRTAILISHRLSTVRMADRILVLADGRIVEAGAHDDLVGKGGRYAELFEMQARNYR